MSGLRRHSDEEWAKANLAGPPRFATAAVGAAELCAREIPRPRSLLGNGVLVAGGFAIPYGKPGVGKTWLFLNLALSLVRGEPWLGLETPAEGVNVGVLQLELGASSIQTRLRALGVGQHPRDGRLRVVCRPHLHGAVDLCEYAQMADLEQWIRQDQLEVLIVDAFSRAHTASEVKSEELGSVLAAFDALRHDTGCALVLPHHERKQGSNDDDMDALRGHSRLQSDPTLLVRVKQAAGGLRCLVFTKVSESASPDPVWFRLDHKGRPMVVQAPQAKADAGLHRVLQHVLSAPGPVSSGELAKALGVDKSTTTRHLSELVEAGAVVRIGSNKTTRYSAPTGAPAPPAQHEPRAGGSTLVVNGIGDFRSVTGAEGFAGTEGHRRTGATGAPYGAHGGAPVRLHPSPRPADEPEPVAMTKRAELTCPCGGQVMRWGEGGVGICRECHRRFSDTGVNPVTEVRHA